jgi:hypothetical protein
VTYLIRAASESGRLSASAIASIAHANSGLTSIQSIDALPQDLVRNAFRNGTRWAFISLIPWAGVAVFLTVFLSKIPDSDRKMKQEKVLPARTLEEYYLN